MSNAAPKRYRYRRGWFGKLILQVEDGRESGKWRDAHIWDITISDDPRIPNS